MNRARALELHVEPSGYEDVAHSPLRDAWAATKPPYGVGPFAPVPPGRPPLAPSRQPAPIPVYQSKLTEISR